VNVFDGAIIGAGPAGSAAAIGLARAGQRIALIESKPFPRAKVCGEYISPAATDILESMVSPGMLRSAGAKRVGTLVLEEGSREIAWRMPRESWVVSRRSLDAMLLDRARDAGADIFHPARVERVRYAEDTVEIGLASGETIRASIVIHADGIGRHDPSGPVPMRPGVVGLKCHVRGMTIDGLCMRAARGAYIGSVGVERGEGTIALVARSDLLRHHGGNPDALVRAAWPAFDPAHRIGDWLSCGVAGSRYIEPGHARSFRIGNAAAAVEPVGGEGIGLAMWAGVTLAELLSQTGALAVVHRRFARMYRARIRVRRHACRLGAEVLMRPALVRALWPVLAVAPGAIVHPWYGLTGKPVRAG